MKKIKDLTIGNWVVIILVSYVIAYTLVGGYNNYQVKNEYEKAKIENYKCQYQQIKEKKGN